MSAMRCEGERLAALRNINLWLSALSDLTHSGRTKHDRSLSQSLYFIHTHTLKKAYEKTHTHSLNNLGHVPMLINTFSRPECMHEKKIHKTCTETFGSHSTCQEIVRHISTFGETKTCCLYTFSTDSPNKIQHVN